MPGIEGEPWVFWWGSGGAEGVAGRGSLRWGLASIRHPGPNATLLAL